MALPIDIADGVTAELAGGTFDPAFTPQRMILPSHDLAELRQLRVIVVPKAIEMSVAGRAATACDVQVDIGVQKKLSAAVDEQVVALCGLVEQIAAYLERRPLADRADAAWVSTANDPIYAPDHLSEQRVFTSILTLTYRVLR
jgi:hypothetical protein